MSGLAHGDQLQAQTELTGAQGRVKLQDRDAAILVVNAVIGALGGLLFWVIITRYLGFDTAQVGMGAAVVSLGTIVGLVGKGGLDASLIRTVPMTSSTGGRRLLRAAVSASVAVAVALTIVLAIIALVGSPGTFLPGSGWFYVGLIGAALSVNWLVDAHFLAEGRASFSLGRNMVFIVARNVAPPIVVLIPFIEPIGASWSIGLVLATLVGLALVTGLPARPGPPPVFQDFHKRGLLNISGNAAEAMPGLLLAPIVLIAAGPAEAGVIGLAWAAASVFLIAALALCRSAFVRLAKGAREDDPAVVRRVVIQVGLVLTPAIALAILLAPWLLSVFGPDFAAQVTPSFRYLAASTVIMIPVFLYMTLLRVREDPRSLVMFPLVVVGLVSILTFVLGAHAGLPGVIAGWYLAYTPLAMYSTWGIRQYVKEVNTHRRTVSQYSPVDA